MSRIVESITDLIGDTPIVKLNKLGPKDGANLYAKLEFFNPGGSVKDRISLGMIVEAEKTGKLKPGDTIIEPTSGNTGIGLAMVAAARGYKCIIVMPDMMSVERRLLMKAYGAELVLTPGAEGMTGAINKATELAEEHGYFMPAQFDNPANPATHLATTGPEIIDAFGDKKLAAFVAGVGTGGTVTGISHSLKKQWPDMKAYAVEPSESPVLEGGKPGPHKIQGIGAGFIPKVLDEKSYDAVIGIPSSEAREVARQAGTEEGFLVGFSAGAAIAAGQKVAAELSPEENVLVLIPDNGERYLSTALYKHLK